MFIPADLASSGKDGHIILISHVDHFASPSKYYREFLPCDSSLQPSVVIEPNSKMSAVDDVDHTFNTTSIPPTGVYLPTPNQFFCQMTKKDVQCVSLAQFAAQPFHQLCPSGDCWTDCPDLARLYAPLPGEIAFANETSYGTPPDIILWPLCAGLANITQALHDEIAPKAEADKFRSFFTNSTQENLRAVAAATTQCWTETCAAARHPDNCTDPCAAVNLSSGTNSGAASRDS